MLYKRGTVWPDRNPYLSAYLTLFAFSIFHFAGPKYNAIHVSNEEVLKKLEKRRIGVLRV